MPQRIPTHRPKYAKANKHTIREYEERRGSAASRGYGSKWRKARETYLKNNPLCLICEAKGRVTAANVVDHITPHKGDKKLFWDVQNWQPLCKPCHDKKTLGKDARAGRGDDGAPGG